VKKRLSKWLASAGVASRRACETLIFQGRVKVNGITVLQPQTLVDENDQMTVDGQPILGEEPKVYFILNKPPGYLCTTKRYKESKLILDLFPEEKERLFTVGRLDKNTTGILLVTNDGHFANRVIHPSSNIHKEYLVKTDQEITHEHLVALSRGAIVEGTFVRPIKVQKVRKGTLKIVLLEGKKERSVSFSKQLDCTS
jgi:23S rRNA pseudouridine2605 synthase